MVQTETVHTPGRYIRRNGTYDGKRHEFSVLYRPCERPAHRDIVLIQYLHMLRRKGCQREKSVLPGVIGFTQNYFVFIFSVISEAVHFGKCL